MKKKRAILFALLLFLLIPSIEAEGQEVLVLDLATSIEQAIGKNQELDLIQREERLAQRIEEKEKRSLHIALSSQPQITYRGGELLPTFRPGITVTAEREALGGTLYGHLNTSVDVIQNGEVESTLSISFHLPLARPTKEEDQEEESAYCKEKEILIERVIETYYALLLKEKEIGLLEQALHLRQLELEAAQYTQVEEEKKKALERVLEIERQVEESRLAKEELERTFRRLLYLEEERFILVEDFHQPWDPLDFDYWADKAYQHHQSIRAAKERLQSASRGEGSFMDSGWSVDLATGLDPYSISPLYEDPSFFIRVEAGRTFSLGRSFKREKEELKRERASLELERAVENIEGQVRRSIQQLQLALKEVEDLIEEIEASKKNLHMVETKSSLGLIGPLELEEGRLLHSQLQYSLLAKKSSLYARYLDLLKSCGLTLAPEEGVRP